MQTTLIPVDHSASRAGVSLPGVATALPVAVAAMGLVAAGYVAVAGGEQLSTLGYFGVFALALATSATVVLPVPGVALVIAAGAVLEPTGVGIAAGLGATLGELTGFYAGRLGSGLIGSRARHERLGRLVRRAGGPVVAVLAFVPSPLFDIAGYLAGAGQMRVGTFLCWCAAGKVPKMLLFAYAGAASPGLLAGTFRLG